MRTSQREHHERQSAPVRSWGLTIALVLLTLTVAVVGWLWWQSRQPPPLAAPNATSSGSVLAPTDEVAPPTQAAEPAAGPAPAVAAAASGPKYPIGPAGAAGKPGPASLADADAQLRPEVRELVGSKAIAEFLQIDNFARRMVATVDNLTRAQAPGSRWPTQPATGQFAVTGEGGARTIDPANSARYEPFVRFAEAVDSASAAAVYRKHYPLFQQAYEELGYPGRYFNDRLVAVIDHLLQTPEPAAPPRVTQVEIKGPFAAEKPWTRYEFADPKLEALSAGQKMMLRMGLENERRVKAKLAELRALITTPPEQAVSAAPGQAGPAPTVR